jgi:hypothetical protein
MQTGDGKTVVAREQLCGHVASPAKTEQAIIKAVFPVRFVPALYNEDHWGI